MSKSPYFLLKTKKVLVYFVSVLAEGGSLDANEEHTLSVSAGERKGGNFI